MLIGRKHNDEWEGILTDFSGGVDRSRPPFLIDAQFAYDMTNFYYDPATGYPTTRPGLKKHSSAAAPNAINGVYELVIGGVSTTVISCEDGKLYKLDGALAPALIGTLSGTERPMFGTLNGKLVVASGSVLQTSDGATLSNTTSPDCKILMDSIQKSSARVAVAGNATTPDRVNRGGTNDPTDWNFAGTEANAKYLEAGYKDGLEISGLCTFQNETFIHKRTPNKGQRRILRANLSADSSAWYCYEFSRSRAALSPHLLCEVGDVFFLDLEGPQRLTMVENQGSVPWKVIPYGTRVSGEISKFIATDGFMWYDPVFRIIMIKPTKNSEQFYCVDPAAERWTYFRFAPNILCGAYVGGKMLFGAADGYVYEYDLTSATDDGAAYTKTIETKWFDLNTSFRNLLKDKYLNVIGVTAGSLSMGIKVAGELKYTKVINFDEAWWSWARVNATLPADWTELLTKTMSVIYRDKQAVSGDQFSIVLTVTSGLCSIGQLGGRVAVAGRA